MKELSYRSALAVSALPTASTALKGVTVRLTTDDKPYWCNGTTWVDLTSTGGGGSPGGNSGEIQYNNGGALGGIANWEVDGGDIIILPNSTPSAPPSGSTKLFGKLQAGRVMPAFIGPSGLDTVLQPHMAKNGWAQWKPAGTGTTISAIGAAALTAIGTATAATYATTSLHTRCARIDYLVTTAATTAVAGFRNATNAYRVTDGFHMIFRVAPATGGKVATGRFFCGMSTSTAAPTDVNPSTLTNTCGVGYAKGTDSNWQIYFAGTAVNKVDTGIAVPSADRTGPYTVIVYSPPGGKYIGVKFVDEATGKSFETTTNISTNMIAATTACGPRGYHSVGGTSSVVGLTLFSGYMESDN